jgi:hypothetical protein
LRQRVTYSMAGASDERAMEFRPADAFVVTLRTNITWLVEYAQLPAVYAFGEYIENGWG